MRSLFGFLFCSLVVLTNAQNKKIFLQKPSNDRSEVLLIITFVNDDPQQVEHCEIYTDEAVIKDVLQEGGEDQISKPSVNEMRDHLKNCLEFLRSNARTSRSDFHGLEYFSESRRRTPISSDAEMRVSPETLEKWKSEPHNSSTVFPGTKWCGAGDKAQSYDDLGSEAETDKCCRAHDLCDDMLRSGEKKGDLINDSQFTLLSCGCDEEFYSCLETVNTGTANTIGNLYFNLLDRKCYKLDYPVVKCLRYKFLSSTCAEYERDTTAPMVLQWAEAKRYNKIPFIG
ncbi:uncharacterized protein LOC118195049 [Stegodyphus dumicola]|uniref:uncharacterized protein LOC118195049 n=1 Tax=Stegodyphus dumicola TaxID=202533 RepID=UPI0015ACC854|nr:uncharacterized protein LOC118195049 [Stegodyphus dumicola]